MPMKYINYYLYDGNGRDLLLRFLLLVICSITLTWLVISVASQWGNIIYSLNTADHHLMAMLNFTGSAATDKFWYDYSCTAVWIPLTATAILMVARTQRGNVRGTCILLLAIGLTVALTDQISSSICKPFFARLRPSHDPSICYMLHYVNNYRGGNYGFVSSHAANVTGLVTWLFWLFSHRIMRLVFLLFAIMTCYSRIYLGVHFPGDVIMGCCWEFSLPGPWANALKNTACTLRARTMPPHPYRLYSHNGVLHHLLTDRAHHSTLIDA